MLGIVQTSRDAGGRFCPGLVVHFLLVSGAAILEHGMRSEQNLRKPRVKPACCSEKLLGGAFLVVAVRVRLHAQEHAIVEQCGCVAGVALERPMKVIFRSRPARLSEGKEEYASNVVQ